MDATFAWHLATPIAQRLRKNRRIEIDFVIIERCISPNPIGRVLSVEISPAS
jgi:hypothetical protein